MKISHTNRTKRYYTTQVRKCYLTLFVLTFLSLCIGVFSDVLNLVFRDKSSRRITSDGVEVVGNISLDSPETRQRELILSKCLEFLRLLAKYSYNHYIVLIFL